MLGQSFSEFLRDAEGLVVSQQIQSDAGTITFRSVLADKPAGDFNQQLTQIKMHESFKNITYDQVVDFLKSI